MDLDHAAKLCQKCIRNNPVLILGSGSSIPHGLGSMGGLADYLIQNIVCDEGMELDAWMLVKIALASGDGLEDALLNNRAPSILVEKIVRLTWKYIAEDDLELLRKVITGTETFPLSAMLNSMMQSTHRTVEVVTTNYDRVCEYAADMAGLIYSTGFAPGIIQSREGSERIQISRGKDKARTVRIWKVHGSLDWFGDVNGNVKSLPLSLAIPDTLTPLIVTPGDAKFERTYDEPFRSAIQGADEALKRASGFVCVGYGFRDTHVQPKLIERSKNSNVPVAVLAKELTEETIRFLSDSAGKNYIAFEEHTKGTKAYSAEYPDGFLIPDHNLWSLESFNNFVF